MTQQDELVLPTFNEGGRFGLLRTILQDLAPELLNYPLLLQLMQHFVFQHTQQDHISNKKRVTLEEIEQEIANKLREASAQNLEFISTTLLGMQITVDTYELYSVQDLEHFLKNQQERIRDNISKGGGRSYRKRDRNSIPNDNHREENKT